MNWKFETISAGIEKQGIRDNDIQVFDQFRIPSVVRESIQNSLDAVLDDTNPVRVEFHYGELDKAALTSLFEIEARVKACHEGDTLGSEDEEVLDEMVSMIEKNPVSVPFLKISDFNTLGLQKDGAYNAFAFSRNINHKKDDTSGGSKGMGKSAFFSNSYLRTILVSSLYAETGETLFQGIARLASHQFGGENYYFKGFFGNDDFLPTTVPPMGPLHANFSRIEPGTTLGIIGVWEENSLEIESQFVKAVLKSFWLAILNKKLEVKINSLLVDSTNVYELVCRHWPDYQGNKTGENINPRQYIETFLQMHEAEKFTASIPYLGKVSLTLSKHPEFNGYISYFRKSNMLIESSNKRGNEKHMGYSGVFVCEDKHGNQLLKRLENPRHDQWSANNSKHPESKKALTSLGEFITKCYQEFYSIQSGGTLILSKLNEFLQIDTGNQKSSRNKSFEKLTKSIKPVKRTTKGGGGEKKIFGLRCFAQKDLEGDWVYQATFRGKETDPNACFEVLVGGDSEKAGKDNKIPVLKVNGVLVPEGSNEFKAPVQSGRNQFTFVLNDSDKHSIRLKLI